MCGVCIFAIEGMLTYPKLPIWPPVAQHTECMANDTPEEGNGDLGASVHLSPGPIRGTLDAPAAKPVTIENLPSPEESDGRFKVANTIAKIYATSLIIGVGAIVPTVLYLQSPRSGVDRVTVLVVAVASSVSLAFLFLFLWPKNPNWIKRSLGSGVPSLVGAIRLLADFIGIFPSNHVELTYSSILPSRPAEADRVEADRVEAERIHRSAVELINELRAQGAVVVTKNDAPDLNGGGQVGQDPTTPDPDGLNPAPESAARPRVTDALEEQSRGIFDNEERDDIGELPRVSSAATRYFDESRQRLIIALDSMEKKSRRNLQFGLILSLSGLTVVGYAVYDASSMVVGETPVLLWESFAVATVPRFVLGIILELIAMFFLRLYRQGIDDFKYFHNELTNIELRWLALNSAYDFLRGDSMDVSIAANAIARLAETERNFVLKEGESTVRLERDRIQTEAQLGSYNAIRTIGTGVVGVPGVPKTP